MHRDASRPFRRTQIPQSLSLSVPVVLRLCLNEGCTDIAAASGDCCTSRGPAPMSGANVGNSVPVSEGTICIQSKMQHAEKTELSCARRS